MARRPIFIPAPDQPGLVRVLSAELSWSPGFALIQKKKNIHALHETAASIGLSPVLEISTKSDDKLGRHLSAFHLKVWRDRQRIPLESAYQGSKVFEAGGPYTDLYLADVRKAKRDVRLQTSGRIVAFEFDGVRFPTEPKTLFYDWLYVNAVFEHREWLRSRLSRYAAFTDIEFNPERSINCQARSCALFLVLLTEGILDTAVKSPQQFLDTIWNRQTDNLPRELPRSIINQE